MRRLAIAALVAIGLAPRVAADVEVRPIEAVPAREAPQRRVAVVRNVDVGERAEQGAGRAYADKSEIPLFPLPEVVLFPGVDRPLVIYEPRYREMVADALKGDRMIGMVLLRPGFEKDYDGRPPIFAVGCAGRIVESEQLPDGRYIILLRGLTTFRILSEDQRKPYRLARVETIPDTLESEDLAQLSALRERLATLLVLVLPPDVDPPDPAMSDAEYVNLVAQALKMPESDRQALLERDSVLARARALVERLERN